MERTRKTNSRFFGGLMATILIFIGSSTFAYACEGKDYQRTMQILDESIKLGWECGWSGNCDFQRMIELGQIAQQLPLQCQRLIEQVAAALQRNNTTQDTFCHGDVCCGPSGCL